MADVDRAIHNLLFTYAERIDAGDLAGVGALFAKGRIVPSPDTPPDQGVRGAEAVEGMYRATTRLYSDGTPHTKHVTTNVIVEADEAAGTAEARSYFTVLQQLDDFPLQPIISGRYRDTFVCDDGAWRFETRSMIVDLKGDLSRHLLIELP
jgi:3-phenylpropionate/cinnamic acid dioxygenase small subunit